MAMLGLRTLVHPVRDLASAKTWYSAAFEVAPYFDEPFYVGFNIGGYELGLVPPEPAELPVGQAIPDQTAPDFSAKPSIGGVAYWGVEDIVATYDRLLALGALSVEPPNNVGGPIEVATLADPDGNLIGLIYNPLFKLP